MSNQYKLGEVEYKIDHQGQILYARRTDELTTEGVFAEWQAMQQLEGFDPAYDTIVDYSAVTEVGLNVQDLMEINRLMPLHDPRTGNVAIVSGLDQGRYLLARFFCTVANMLAGRSHQVFRSVAEAEIWVLSLRECDNKPA